MEIVSFVTLMGLFISWIQERKGQEHDRQQLSILAFCDWMQEHGHTELVELLHENHHLLQSLKELVEAQHSFLAERVEHLEHLFMLCLSRAEGWSDVVAAAPEHPQLSDQAVEILEGFYKSGADLMYTYADRSGVRLLLPEGGRLPVTDPRMLPDDLDTLVDLKLISEELGETGSRYSPTRTGEKFVAGS